ncbi:MAG TPA: Ig-like domain-containing protein, partial [Vicinamibacteria bacterium]
MGVGFRLQSSGLAILMLAATWPRALVQGQGAARLELVSAATDGQAGNNASGLNGSSSNLSPRTRISGDNRYVVFESEASNLVCSDPNFTSDVFRRDRASATTVLVSVATDGGPANHASTEPVVSLDGRYVAFASLATNLVAGSDTNDTVDIFWRDLEAGITKRVSVSSNGEGGDSVSHAAAISGDGRYVVFFSSARNLVPDDTNGVTDVFVHDVVTGETERVSVSSAGVQGTCCRSVNPSLSADGRYVLFLSQNRFDPAWSNNTEEMYLRDRQLGTTTLITPTTTNGLSNAGISSAQISPDGRYVTFQTSSTNVVVPDANGFNHDVFVRDLLSGITTLVSVASDGTQGNRDSFVPSISAEGRQVAFESWATNLGGELEDDFDVFVRDTALQTTARLSLAPGGGEADGPSGTSSMSADGTAVYFQSTASNLVPGDFNNGNRDVFVHAPPFPGAAGPGFRFEPGAYSVYEAGGEATIRVTRSGNPCSLASVDYATSDGSATAGTDYLPVSGTLTFAPGVTSRSFGIGIVDDASDEPDETVEITLSNPKGGAALASPSTATLVIQDDDPTSNGSPQAADDAGTTAEDTPVAIAVLANDTDPDGDPLAIAGFTQGVKGLVTEKGDGSLTYAPSANANGSDTFLYTVGDGRGGMGTALVVVNITPVNDAPVAAPDQYSTPRENILTVAVASGVLANDADVDGDALTAQFLAGPAHGALLLRADGSFSYGPEDGFAGTDSFTYSARDSQPATSNATTVTIVVERGEVARSTCRPVIPRAVHPAATSCDDV